MVSATMRDREERSHAASERLASALRWSDCVSNVRKYLDETRSTLKLEKAGEKGDALAHAVCSEIARVAVSELPAVHAALHRRASKGDPKAIELYLIRWDQDFRAIKAEMEGKGKDGADVQGALEGVIRRLSASSSPAPRVELTQTTKAQSVTIQSAECPIT